MTGRRSSLNPWVLLIAGLVIAGIAIFMLRAGYSNRAAYESFQRCQEEASAPVCVLVGARSPGEFTSNYKSQILGGQIGIGVGVLVAAYGTAMAVAQRRRSDVT